MKKIRKIPIIFDLENSLWLFNFVTSGQGGKARQSIPRHLYSASMTNFVRTSENLDAKGVAFKVNDFKCTQLTVISYCCLLYKAAFSWTGPSTTAYICGAK